MCGGTLVARASHTRNTGLRLGILLLLFSIAHLPLLRHADAKILEGELITRENWAFVARFCFLTESGTFRYHFQLGGEERELKLLLYYDGPHQWPTVYPSNKTCEEKESILDIDYGQIVPLNTSKRFSSGCVRGDDGVVRCDSQRKFISARPRWWFIVLADCASMKGLNVTYWISLTNAPAGAFWKEHFSADEFYILPLLIPTVCMYMIFIILSFYIALQLRSRRLLHVSYKLFIASLLCQLTGVSCELYSYVNLGLRGVPAMDAYLLGQLLEACSETLYTILLLLLALGYTITKSVLTSSQIRWLILFVSVTALFQLSLFGYQSEAFDPGLVLYMYESPPGYGLIALKLISWFVFVTRCFRTIRKLNTKLHFYTSLLFLGSVWFLFHPLTVLINTVFVDKWVRESMAKGSSLFIVFVGHIMFLYVTRPSVNNKRFPFHIRTFQVVPIGGHGQDHSYEPGPRTAVTAFTITRTPAYISQTR
ncbi:PREDICTED: transmembrane protein 145-like [Wasmannia auropunctata]|uniref:transmembrane protein 145-like n=1 Tax=Wasmannia auropunctata TaxID=64793 RepID=UPI0005EF48D5|nr:PREDICTED: transmembrane protein 145-like [Wasmannia auropunctata]XP_011695343.1 PREDICTED: transmembrane protein 145-like [Wasmannia auropunctata]XP_011695351.1 PREDICTED: transmembrane protein 145-like [Wasmannia auropunctata]